MNDDKRRKQEAECAGSHHLILLLFSNAEFKNIEPQLGASKLAKQRTETEQCRRGNLHEQFLLNRFESKGPYEQIEYLSSRGMTDLCVGSWFA